MAEQITIYDDTSFHAVWPLLDDDDELLDVTGWTVSSQIKATTEVDAPVLETFEASLQTGQLTLQLDPEVRAWRRGRFDVRLVSPDGDVSRPVFGRVTNGKTITR